MRQRVSTRVSAPKRKNHVDDNDDNQRPVKLTALQEVRAARKQRKARKRLAATLHIATEMFATAGNRVAFDKSGLPLPDFIDFSCFCPHCNEHQTADNVLDGASDTPYDITTECSKCHQRYTTTVTVILKAQETRIPWLCPDQTRDQYAYWGGGDVLQDIFEERPDIYWNALKYSQELYPECSIHEAMLKFLRGPDVDDEQDE